MASRKTPSPALGKRARAVRLVVFDFDGVMTDNRVWVLEDGREAVACNRADGWGIARLRETGLHMMVLSTESNPVVAARCRKLQIECTQAVGDKAEFLARHLAAAGIAPAETAFVGNDVNDLGCLHFVGLPVAVADADPTVARAARWVLKRRGGDGAVREFCDQMLCWRANAAGAR